MMEALFLRVLAVSAAVSLLLLPLLLCGGRLERKYAPQTRWGLWLAVALVLLIAPFLPKAGAPVVVEAPAYTLSLPAARSAGGERGNAAMPEGKKPAGGGVSLPEANVQPPAEPLPKPPTVSPPESEAPASQAPEVRSTLSLTALAAGMWLGGLLLILLWQGGGYLLLRRRLLKGACPDPGLERYAKELGLEGKARFFRCQAIPGPMTLGVFRPVILLPPGEPAAAALRHELYHVKRRDVAYKALILCACALHWFNPLVWRLLRWADRDVEACCDAAVVAGRDPEYKRSYGELLLSAASGPRTTPFTTSFGGGATGMKARLTQLFRPGKRSRVLVCAVLLLAALLGSLVACRPAGTGKLADGVYCSPYANVVWPVGEPDAEGEDYGSIRLSLLEYSETEGPHGKPLGEYTLPLSEDLMLRQLWWGEDRNAGEKGTAAWEKAVFELLRWPVYRDMAYLDSVDYLVATVKNGEITRLSWAQVDRDDTLYTNDTYRFTLRLPESWAGNYTLEEGDGKVRFLYAENGEPLMTLHITEGDGGQEGWELLGIDRYHVYAELPGGEEDTTWGELREEMLRQLHADSGFGWMDVGLQPWEGYTDEHYGFTLRLPESWVGRYEVEFGSDEYGVFWRFRERSGEGELLGELFTLDLWNVWKDEEEPRPDAARGRGILGVRDRGDYWEVCRMTAPTWLAGQGDEELRRDVRSITPADFRFLTGTSEPQALTENTMPTLVYYDPQREFLLYRTLDTACFYYGGELLSYQADQSEGRRVLWRCDVSEDEKTVYLSDVFDDSAHRDERFYAWDIETRTLKAVDAIPPGVDHMTHVDGEELFYSGFMNGTALKSNVIRAKDGTLAGLFVDELIGNTLEYLQLTRMKDGSYLGGSPFLTPERIPAPRDYRDPEWGFTLHLPESMEGEYYVQKGGNGWYFYDKEQVETSGGFLMGLWAEDADTFRSQGNSGRVLGEKGGICYSLSFWPEEDLEGVPEERRAAYTAMLRDVSGMDADSLDLSGVTRTSGYLWPLPYTEYGSDVLLGEEDSNTLRILSPEGVTVQSVAGGRVKAISVHPITGEQTVYVVHSDGLNSEYGHLEYVEVEDGAEIKRGEIIGIARAEYGRRWLNFRLLGGSLWDTAASVDPWSVEYRTYDFLPVTRDRVTIAGDPAIENILYSVLRGETEFFNVETGESCLATALPDSDGVPVKGYRYARVDMDGDTIPETVLWLQRGEDVYQLGSIILRYEGGVVYGYPMGYRSLDPESLKADGSYIWSGGAANNGWGRMNFRTGETENISWVDGESCYVDGRSTSREEFSEAYDRWNAKPDVVWVKLP